MKRRLVALSEINKIIRKVDSSKVSHLSINPEFGLLMYALANELVCMIVKTLVSLNIKQVS